MSSHKRPKCSWSSDELSRIDLSGLLEYAIRARVTRTLSVTKSYCLKNNIPYDITVDDLYPLPLTCPVLGVALNWMSEGKGSPNDCPSIDRLEPAKGYTKGNVRIISQKANRLKSNASTDELEAILRYMKEHATERGNNGKNKDL